MKKVFFILLGLATILAIGVAVFIFTFNANQYRPWVEDKMQEALGGEVGIGHINLTWNNGIALSIEDLEISDEKGKSKADISLKKAQAVVAFLPLLKKDIQLASIELTEPNLHIIRDKNNQVRVVGIGLTKESSSSEAQSSQLTNTQKAQGAITFLIKKIKIDNGIIRFEDQMAKDKVDITVRDADLVLKNVSPIKPIEFNLDASLFSPTQNFSFDGIIHDVLKDERTFTKLQLESNLDAISYSELIRSLPMLKTWGVDSGLKGRLKVDIPKMVVAGEGLKELEVDIQFKDGNFKHLDIAEPIQNIQMQASGNMQQFELKNLSASFVGGNFRTNGKSVNIQENPRTNFKIDVDKVSLNRMIQAFKPSKVQVNGNLSFDFNGDAVGKEWDQWSKTLNGQGSLTLTEGVILNYNIAQDVLGKLSMFPGLVESVYSRLPAEYQQKLTRRDTVLAPIEESFTVKNGNVNFTELAVRTELVALYANANLNLSGVLEGNGVVLLDPTLSGAMAQSFEQVQLLMNDRQQIEIPLRFRMDQAGVAVLPDIGIITQKLFSSRGREMLSNLFDKVSGSKEAASSGEAATAAATESQPASPEATLAQLLQKALN